MAQIVITGNPEGQRPLLDGPPCPHVSCEREADQFKEALWPIIMGAASGPMCPLATATCLILLAASLVNPVNAATVEDRQQRISDSHALAALMGKCAQGIDMRASS